MVTPIPPVRVPLPPIPVPAWADINMGSPPVQWLGEHDRWDVGICFCAFHLGFGLVLPVATTILAGRDGQASRPPASSCAGRRLCRYTVRVNSIDTPSDSHKSHCVNRFVRGFCPPGSHRISPACFRPSRLRMRHIIHPQVVVPAIQSTPIAAHSVATIAYLAFRLAGTILIPDCAPPQRLSTAFFPQLSPAPIYSSGRSRP